MDNLGLLTKYKKNKYKNSILSAFSFNKRLFKIVNYKEIRLEKNTYWILNFNINKKIEIYINNDLVLLDNINSQYRIPYKTHNIKIARFNEEEELNIIFEITESKFPTYRLLWKDIFITENTLNYDNKLKFLDFNSTKKKSIINFKNLIGINNKSFSFKVNFRYENLNGIIINNKENTKLNNYCDDIYENNEGNLSFYFNINRQTILHNGTVTLLEDEKILGINDKLISENNNKFEEIISNRISDIKLNNLGCDFNAKNVIHSLPTFQVKLQDDKNIDYDKLKLAIKVYEIKNNLPRVMYLDWNIDYKKDDFINFELFKNNKTEEPISNTINQYQTVKTHNYYKTNINNNCEENIYFLYKINFIIFIFSYFIMKHVFNLIMYMNYDKIVQIHCITKNHSHHYFSVK